LSLDFVNDDQQGFLAAEENEWDVTCEHNHEKNSKDK